MNLFILALDYLIIACAVGIIFSIFTYLFFGGKQGKAIPFLPAMIVAFWLLIIFGGEIVMI